MPAFQGTLIVSGSSLTTAAAREKVRFEIPMPLAALRDPANETPPADSLGLAGCETLIVARARDALAAAAARAEGPTLTNVNDVRATLIDGAPVGG